MKSGKILIIDDDASFRQMYEDRLGEEGYVVETAPDQRTALAKLDQPGWDAILIDQKLQGEGGPDTGLDLIAEAAQRAPGAKAFLVTGYATPKAIARAFREGAYDYLQKDQFFSALLAPKLRNAIEAVRALRLAELTSAETEEQIRETWTAVEAATDPNRKGKLLEDLMVLLFKTIPGFHQTTPNRQNDIEEIDLLIQNASPDPFWINERSSYILVECKNWSKPAGAPELRALFHKLERRYGRSRLGFFIAPGGFAGTFKDALLAERKGDLLIVLVDHDALAELVRGPDRGAILKRFHERAVMALNGH
jgi:CheY-like chemotaxis protein